MICAEQGTTASPLIIDPTLSTTIFPDFGFLIDSIYPLIEASTSEYSKDKSQLIISESIILRFLQ